MFDLSGISVLLSSPHYSPLSLPSWGPSHEAGLRCCCCCSSWWACHCQRMDCHLWRYHKNELALAGCQRTLLDLLMIIPCANYLSLHLSCTSHLCCCCSGRPARWWVRSRHGSRCPHSAHQYYEMSCSLAALQEALWGEKQHQQTSVLHNDSN